MKVLRRTERELVLQERPGLVWLVGGLFTIAGLLVAAISTDKLFGAAFALVGLVLLLAFANYVTSTFDLTAGRFTRTVKGLIRRSEASCLLADIVGLRVEQGLSSRPSRSYRLALVLRSGDRLPLTTSYSTGRQDKERVAEVIRVFLELNDPGELPLPGFGDMVGLMFDSQGAQKLSDLYGGVVAEHEATVERNPDNLEAQSQLAIALAMQNKPDQARAHLTAARDIAARDGHAKLAAQFDLMLTKLDEATNRAH